MNRRRLPFPSLLLLCLAWTSGAAAQSTPPRLELAAQANLLYLSDFDTTNAGIGGRLSLDLTPWLTLDGTVTFYPRDRVALPQAVPGAPEFRVVSDRRRTDALVGVRVGRRGERIGAFVTAMPGVTRLTERRSACEGPGCAVVLLLRAPNTYRTELAVAAGGGVEYYPSARTVVRAEFGDTIIRHRSTAPPCPASACTSHNFSTRFGLGYRF